MSHTLVSPHLQFTINPDTASWSVHSVDQPGASVEEAWLRVSYRTPRTALHRTGRRRHQALEQWRRPVVQTGNQVDSPHGPLTSLVLETGPDTGGLYYQAEFALTEQHPFLLWRLTIDNRGPNTVEINKITLMQAGAFPRRQWLPDPGAITGRYRGIPVGYGAVRPHASPGTLGFFSNGWQSWSYTGAYGPHDTYRGTWLNFLAAQMWYSGGKSPAKKPGLFTSDMFGVLGDRTHRHGILAGFLAQKQHFGALDAWIADPLTPALRLHAAGDHVLLAPGSQMQTDWAVLQFIDLDAPDPLGPYLEAVAREHAIHPSTLDHAPNVGWCSWYQFFQDIDADKMRANLKTAAALKDDLSLDLFQIDDGFQAQVGDWLEPAAGFPDGVAPLAVEAGAVGLTPGLWLAPFILHSRSKLRKTQANWLLRNRFGVPKNAGFVWNNLNKGLDLTRPEALHYVREVIDQAVHHWGYRFLKLDFLYAAALQGRFRDRSKTRAQVLRVGLEAIREAAGPDVHLLGCGVPLGSSIGIFDSLRIGADVDPAWLPGQMGLERPFLNEPNLPSTRNALQNTLTRAPLHRRWWINDPDCLMIRPDSELSLAEIQSLATAIALTGGTLLLSDDLPQLPPERLQIAQQLVPLIGLRPRVLDWFDSPTPRLLRLDLENITGAWHLLAIFNWSDQPTGFSQPLADFDLPAHEYHARDFWTGSFHTITGGQLDIPTIPPHGVSLLALRTLTKGQPAYLGGNLHISQGLEASAWSITDNELTLSLSRPGNAAGHIDLYLPTPPTAIQVDSQPIQPEPLGENRCRIPLQFRHQTKLIIK